MISPLALAVLFVGATCIGYVAVAGIRAFAERRQILDIPNERSSHVRPMPRGGGIAIVLVTLSGAGLLWVWFGGEVSPWLAYALGGAAIAAISGLDDIRPTAFSLRLAVHTIAAVLVIGAFVGTTEPGVDPGWRVGLLAIVLLVWTVGLTNAFNFMDGIDGIAGTQAVVAGLGWCLLGAASGQWAAATVGALVAGSSLGFLGHNWPPARIFMGDVSSAFLGFTFAVLVVQGTRSGPTAAVAGGLLVWPFVFDTGLTIVRRLRAGENIFAAHRSHLYQRLVIAGASHREATCTYAVLAIGCVLAAMLWHFGDGPTRIGVAGALGAMALGLWAHVRRRERQRASRPS